MVDAIITPLKMQQAAMIAGYSYLCAAANAWLRMLKGETELITFPFHRRAQDLHTGKAIVATGATWNDHYGRRAHDVDVEHMR